MTSVFQLHRTFLRGSLDDGTLDRPTDHATRSVTIGSIYVRVLRCGLIITVAYLDS